MELPADANETFGTTRFYYLTYKIASAFSIYALPIVTRVGVVGNTISMCVMFQRNNRKHSFGSYLGPPAVSATSVVCLNGLPASMLVTFEATAGHRLPNPGLVN